MLLESVSYMGELPFELSFLNVAEESKHCHKEIEILLVLRGMTHYQIYHTDYELSPGDLIIADVEDLHQIHGSTDDILMLSIHVDTGRFEHLYPNIRYMFFVCEECMEGPAGNRQLLESKLTRLKGHIAKLAMDYTKKDKDMPLLMDEISELVSILVNHFQGFFMEDYQYKTSQEDMSPDDLQRLSRITRYIMLNYKEKITLDDVSNMEHLSSYYVSHLIKKTLGFNFQNFVNAIRLEYAEKLLVFTNMTLMQISEECGFSSPNYFNKCFSAWHGKTPAQYRKAYHPCERSFKAPFTQEEALSLVAPFLNVIKRNYEPPARITVEPDFEKGKFVDFWEICAPRIVVDSLESALNLGYYWETLQRLRPAAFILDENLTRRNKDLEKSLRELLAPLNIPLFADQIIREEDLIAASNTASAFEQILCAGHSRVRLMGDQDALFTAGGLKTPAFQVYDYFSQLAGPQFFNADTHILIKCRDARAILLFNTDSTTVLDINFVLTRIPDQDYLVRREFSQRENCYSVLGDLEAQEQALPPLLIDRINQSFDGKVHFFRLDKDLQEDDFLIDHNTAVVLEIMEPPKGHDG
ncbi:helix-turn-helix domain-containing protein [Hominibacterium faecale]|uniref:helix-turn-helix domain-containing protein n=1 Tax=Hominibacterium faecale TaxID=2839743 RepID=UPI0022B29D64|nr:AraC family transcriptional regulator [Hominibacterium faecale]